MALVEAGTSVNVLNPGSNFNFDGSSRWPPCHVVHFLIGGMTVPRKQNPGSNFNFTGSSRWQLCRVIHFVVEGCQFLAKNISVPILISTVLEGGPHVVSYIPE